MARTTEFMAPHRSEVSSVPSRRFFRIAPSSAASSAEPRCRGRGISTLKSCGDAAVLDDQHAIGQRDRLGDVMRHQDRGKALIVPDPLQQPLHRNPRQRIERAERLVERQHARPADQRARQRHALLLSAGQHRRPLRPLVVETDLDQRALGARLRVRRIPLAAEADFDIRQHPRPWQQPRLLEHHADVLRARVLAEADRAGGGGLQARRSAAAACSCRSRCGRRSRRTGRPEYAGRCRAAPRCRRTICAIRGWSAKARATALPSRAEASRACSTKSARSTGSAPGERKRRASCISCPQCFWKAGCQDSVSRSSAREALSASLPSKA